MRSGVLALVLAACGSREAPAPPAPTASAPVHTLALGLAGLCSLDEGHVRCVLDDPLDVHRHSVRPPHSRTVREIDELEGSVSIALVLRSVCGIATDGAARCVPPLPIEHPVLDVAEGDEGAVAIATRDAGAMLRQPNGAFAGTPHLPSPVAASAPRFGMLCALDAHGAVRCLSDLATAAAPLDVPPAVAISGGAPFAIVSGDGTLRVGRWGRGFEWAENDPTDLTVIEGISDAVDVAAWGGRVLVRRRGGQVHVIDGRRDDERLPSVPGPVVMEGATAIATTGLLSCARVAGGEIRCVGVDDLGLARPLWTWPPHEVAGIDDARAIAVGGGAACVLRAGSEVRCWGGGRTRRAPDAREAIASLEPVTVDLGLDDVVEIAMPDGRICGRDASGDVRCIVGAGATAAVVPNVPAGSVVALGDSVLRTRSGDVYAYDGTRLAQHVTAFSGRPGIWCGMRGTVIACGGVYAADADPFAREDRRHALPGGPFSELRGDPGVLCARDRGGAWHCTGENHVGQLGIAPGAAGSADAPLSGAAWDDLVAYHGGICGWQREGPLTCTGIHADGSPRDPDGDAAERGDGAWVALDAVRDVRDLAITADFGIESAYACAVVGTGRVLCWGTNERGQLGDGLTRLIETPERVASLSP